MSTTPVFHKPCWKDCEQGVKHVDLKRTSYSGRYFPMPAPCSFVPCRFQTSILKTWDFQALGNYKIVMLLDQCTGFWRRHALLCLQSNFKIAIAVLHSHNLTLRYRETSQGWSLGRRSKFSTQSSGWVSLGTVHERCARRSSIILLQT